MATPDLNTLCGIVEAALKVETPEPRDAAVAALALTYAKNIDDGGELSKLGPSLLAALEALHLSPRARATAQKGMKPGAKPGTSQLDELRNRRARKDSAATSDTASA